MNNVFLSYTSWRHGTWCHSSTAREGCSDVTKCRWLLNNDFICNKNWRLPPFPLPSLPRIPALCSAHCDSISPDLPILLNYTLPIRIATELSYIFADHPNNSTAMKRISKELLHAITGLLQLPQYSRTKLSTCYLTKVTYSCSFMVPAHSCGSFRCHSIST